MRAPALASASAPASPPSLRPGRRRPYPPSATAGGRDAQPPPPAVAPPPPSFVAANAAALRSLPLAAGAAGFAAIIANRVAGGGGGGALTAASASARADVVALALAAVLALTGLQWLTLAPKTPEPLELSDWVALDWTHPRLPRAAAAELRWAAAAAAAASRSVALVAFVNGVCVAHIGAAAAGATPGAAAPGPVVDRAVETGAGTYLANLILYPGRTEFLVYLPVGVAGVIVAPAGGAALVLAARAVRGFAGVDQAWAASLAEKLDSTLDGWAPTG